MRVYKSKFSIHQQYALIFNQNQGSLFKMIQEGTLTLQEVLVVYAQLGRLFQAMSLLDAIKNLKLTPPSNEEYTDLAEVAQASDYLALSQLFLFLATENTSLQIESSDVVSMLFAAIENGQESLALKILAAADARNFIINEGHLFGLAELTIFYGQQAIFNAILKINSFEHQDVTRLLLTAHAQDKKDIFDRIINKLPKAARKQFIENYGSILQASYLKNLKFSYDRNLDQQNPIASPISLSMALLRAGNDIEINLNDSVNNNDFIALALKKKDIYQILGSEKALVFFRYSEEFLKKTIKLLEKNSISWDQMKIIEKQALIFKQLLSEIIFHKNSVATNALVLVMQPAPMLEAKIEKSFQLTQYFNKIPSGAREEMLAIMKRFAFVDAQDNGSVPRLIRKLGFLAGMIPWNKFVFNLSASGGGNAFSLLTALFGYSNLLPHVLKNLDRISILNLALTCKDAASAVFSVANLNAFSYSHKDAQRLLDDYDAQQKKIKTFDSVMNVPALAGKTWFSLGVCIYTIAALVTVITFFVSLKDPEKNSDAMINGTIANITTGADEPTTIGMQINSTVLNVALFACCAGGLMCLPVLTILVLGNLAGITPQHLKNFYEQFRSQLLGISAEDLKSAEKQRMTIIREVTPQYIRENRHLSSGEQIEQIRRLLPTLRRIDEIDEVTGQSYGTPTYETNKNLVSLFGSERSPVQLESGDVELTETDTNERTGLLQDHNYS